MKRLALLLLLLGLVAKASASKVGGGRVEQCIVSGRALQENLNASTDYLVPNHDGYSRYRLPYDILRDSLRYTIYLPEGYDRNRNKEYPLLVILFDAERAFPYPGDSGLLHAADSALTRKKVKPMIVVAIDAAENPHADFFYPGRSDYPETLIRGMMCYLTDTYRILRTNVSHKMLQNSLEEWKEYTIVEYNQDFVYIPADNQYRRWAGFHFRLHFDLHEADDFDYRDGDPTTLANLIRIIGRRFGTYTFPTRHLLI